MSSKGRDDKRLFDIYVSFKDYPDERLLVEISKKLTYAALYNNVKQALESKYDHLKGLTGLRVTEIKMLNPNFASYNTRDTKNHQTRPGTNETAGFNKYVTVPDDEDSFCENILASNGHVIVDIESQDIWLNCILKLQSPDFRNFQSSFEIKVDGSISGGDLMTLLQKLSISIWNKLCREVLNDQKDDEGFSQSFVQQIAKSQYSEQFKRHVAKLFVLTAMEVHRFDRYEAAETSEASLERSSMLQGDSVVRMANSRPT